MNGVPFTRIALSNAVEVLPELIQVTGNRE